MKKTYFTLLALFVVFAALGQNGSLERAHKFFEKKNFPKAIELYQNAPESQESLQNLGDSYFYINKIDEAVGTYKKLFDKYDQIDPEYYFRYAHALKGIGNYTEADALLLDENGNGFSTLEAFKKIDQSTNFNFIVNRINENTEHSEFGGAFLGTNLVFASSRNATRPIYVWNNEPYLDLYIGEVGENGGLANIAQFSEIINTDTHETSATFSPDGKMMYFDRTNSEKVKIEDAKVATIQIYKADLVGGEWKNPTPVSFASDEYSTEHPSVSNDGKRLYFSSDMPGSLGSFDIFYVDINPDGTFGKPQNLGPNVNTAHREQFPFINEDGTLYFASNGHKENLGGLDIYYAHKKGDGFSKAFNMGTVVNSNRDDFAYVINNELEMGYFSSNRNNSDDIFSFTKDRNIFIVGGVVKDKTTNKLMPGTLIVISDRDGNKIEEITVDKDASFQFTLKPNTEYNLKSTKDEYEPYTTTFQTGDMQGQSSLIIAMESYDSKEEIVVAKYDKTQIELENIYFEFNKWDITPQAVTVLDDLINLLNKYPEMEIEIASHTDVRGPVQYNQMLSEKRAASTLEYLVQNGIDRGRLTSKGYGESEPLNKCVREGICTDDEYDINRRSEFTILK
ncbi:MAG TPA: OmpA family protein [Salinimicrobium sp.]|nr:OmpA family protein [Salinimicrobium sp.]